MLAKMREVAPTFIVIALLAFVGTIFFSWGMDWAGAGSRPVAGRINGKKIPLDIFARQVEMERGRLTQSSDGEVSQSEYQKVPRKVWDRLVSERLMSETFEDMKLQASADEVFSYLRNNPLPGFDTLSDFQTDGAFDTSKYEAWLSNPALYENPQMLQMELETRHRIVPGTKLEALVSASVLPSRLDLEREYRAQNDKCVFEYAYAPFSQEQVSDSAVSDDEIRTYYTAHPDSFRTPEMSELYFVRLEIKETPGDIQKYYDEMKAIRERLVNGVSSFENEAYDESDDDVSAENGGDLGWFKRGTMVPVFDSAAFNTPVGTITEPIRSTFGFHIIKVEDKRQTDSTEEVHARHILRRITPSDETRDSLRDVMDTLLEVAADEGLLAALEQFPGLHLDSTGLFARGDSIPGIGFVGGLATFAFTGDAGEVGETLFQTQNTIYVVELKRREREGVLTLKDARERIVRSLEKQMREDLAGGRLQKALATVNGGSIAALSEADALVQSGVSDTVVAMSYVPPLGYNTEAAAVAFATQDNATSGLVKLNTGMCVVRPLYHQKADTVDVSPTVAKMLMQRTQMMERQYAMNAWYATTLDKADIQSNVDEHFIE